LKAFIEEILHQDIEIIEYKDNDRLPLVIRGEYLLYTMVIGGQTCILAEPKQEFGLASLRKQQRKIAQLTEQYCVLYLKRLESYQREKMLEEGIPFVWEGHQIYMPFLGILLRQNETRTLKRCKTVSFLTQKLLLTAVYNQWQNMTVTKAARIMDVAKMSVTRCYDEIESLEIPILLKKGRTRMISMGLDKKQMWSMIRPYMRNPMLKEYYLEQNQLIGLPKSGISALCEYSMLDDNEYRTYAILKSQLSEFDIKNKKQVSKGEEPGCIVQELGYVIDNQKEGVIDPLTVFLLMEPEKEEPRIDKALEDMLEEYVW